MFILFIVCQATIWYTPDFHKWKAIFPTKAPVDFHVIDIAEYKDAYDALYFDTISKNVIIFIQYAYLEYALFVCIIKIIILRWVATVI